MRVKLRTLMAGPAGVFQPGQVLTVSTETGQALIAGGYAEPVAEAARPAAETAELPQGETAAPRAPRPPKTPGKPGKG